MKKDTHVYASEYPPLRREGTKPLCGAKIRNPHLFVQFEGDLRGLKNINDLTNCDKCRKEWGRANLARFSFLSSVCEAQEASLETGP